MKVLWLVNITLAPAARALGLPTPVGGGWLDGMLGQLHGRMELVVVSVNAAVGPQARRVEADGVVFRVLPQGEPGDFAALLAEERPDLVQLWGTEYPGASALLAAAGPARTLVTIQGLMGPCAAHLLDGVPAAYCGSTAAQRLVDRVVPGGLLDKQQAWFNAQAKREAALLAKAAHVSGRTPWDRAQLARLAPGADYSACGEILRPGFYTARWPGAPAKPVVFLSQGNYPLKGMHRLIQALPPVLRRYPDLVVRVAGWPPLDKGPLLRPVIRWMFPYQRYLQDLARRLGVAHAIQYTGPLDEAGMLREMRAASLFVLCSSIENSPNSLGEAMLLGMPCVAADTGGVPGMATHEKEALLYPPADPSALSAALLRLLDDPDYAAGLGRAARARALVTHDPAQNARRMESIYHALIQANSAETAPLVTVLVTTYNQERYIRRALDSVLAQRTDFPFEVLVSEDAGTDGTRDILREYAARDSRVRLRLREENVGISRNWYEGLCAARGEYVCTLEGDDWWLREDKLQKQVDFLRAHPDCAAVSHRIQEIDDEGRLYRCLPDDPRILGREVTVEQFLQGITFSCTACMTRNLFRVPDPAREAYVTANRSIADFALCLLYLSAGRVFVLNEALAAYRVAGTDANHQNYNATTTAVQKYRDLLQVVRASETYFHGRYDFTRFLCAGTFYPFCDRLRLGGAGAFLREMGRLPVKAKLAFPFYFLGKCAVLAVRRLTGRGGAA